MQGLDSKLTIDSLNYEELMKAGRSFQTQKSCDAELDRLWAKKVKEAEEKRRQTKEARRQAREARAAEETQRTIKEMKEMKEATTLTLEESFKQILKAERTEARVKYNIKEMQRCIKLLKEDREEIKAITKTVTKEAAEAEAAKNEDIKYGFGLTSETIKLLERVDRLEHRIDVLHKDIEIISEKIDKLNKEIDEAVELIDEPAEHLFMIDYETIEEMEDKEMREETTLYGATITKISEDSSVLSVESDSDGVGFDMIVNDEQLKELEILEALDEIEDSLIEDEFLILDESRQDYITVKVEAQDLPELLASHPEAKAV